MEFKKLTDKQKRSLKRRFRRKLFFQKIEHFFYNNFAWLILGILIGYILKGFVK